MQKSLSVKILIFLILIIILLSIKINTDVNDVYLQAALIASISVMVGWERVAYTDKPSKLKRVIKTIIFWSIAYSVFIFIWWIDNLVF